MSPRLSAAQATVLIAAFAFLYAPIALLILYSFNASRLVTVWGGFSTRWYSELLGNELLLSSALVSMKIALVSAAFATALGTCAALTLARHGRFRGRSIFGALVYAPLVMPEVITGLSLLLLFVALGVERGFWTVVAAHSTIGMCFATVVIHARLVEFDRSLEEAAMDLGASPATAFRLVTLPICAPAIVAAFLLAFTISLDDFVLASFTSGPGSTTLPMRIYSQVRLGISPQINAISTLMIAGAGVLLLAAWLAGGRGRQSGQT